MAASTAVKSSAAEYFASLSPLKDDRSLGKGYGSSPSTARGGRCHCCPYGYHIDLDFVRYCHTLAKGSEQESATLRRLKQSKKQRRRETHSMEMMLGLTQSQEIQQNGVSAATTTTKDVSKVGPVPPPRRNSLKHLEKHLQQHAPDVLMTRTTNVTRIVKSGSISEANSALQEAMQDFEDTLESSHEAAREPPQSVDLLQHSINKNSAVSRRLGVSPAEANTAMASMLAQSAVNRVRNASVTRSNSLPRYFPEESPHAAWFSKVRPSYGNTAATVQPPSTGMTLKDALASLEAAKGSTYTPSLPVPDDSISLASAASQISTSTLQSIRDQMATGLSRLRELEAEVRTIPHLQRQVEKLRAERKELQKVVAFKESDERSEDEWDRPRLLTGGSRNRRRSQSPIRVNLEEFCSYRRARRGSLSDCSDTESVSSELRVRTSQNNDTNTQLYISEMPCETSTASTRIFNGNDIGKLSIRRNKRDASTSCRVLTRDVGVLHAARVRSVGLMADLPIDSNKPIENGVKRPARTSLGSLSGVGCEQERNNAKAKLLSELGRQNSGIISRLSSEICRDGAPPLMFDNSCNTDRCEVRHVATATDAPRLRDQRVGTVLAAGEIVTREEAEREMKIKVMESLEKERDEYEERLNRERRDWEIKFKGRAREGFDKERKEMEMEMKNKIDRERKDIESRVRQKVKEEVNKERAAWENDMEEKIEREKRMWQRQVEDCVNEQTKKSYEEDLKAAVMEKLKRAKLDWEVEADKMLENKLSEARKKWENDTKLRVSEEREKVRREGLTELENLNKEWHEEMTKVLADKECKMKGAFEKERDKMIREHEANIENLRREYSQEMDDKIYEVKKIGYSQEEKIREEMEMKIQHELTKAKKTWEASHAAETVKAFVKHREVQTIRDDDKNKCEKCAIPRRSVGVSWDRVTDNFCSTCKERSLAVKPITKNCYCQTDGVKTRVAACQAHEESPSSKTVATNTSMVLPLRKEEHISITQSGVSPAVTPEQERRPFGSSGVSLCDKCHDTITSVAKDFVGTTGGSTGQPVVSIPLPPSSSNSKIPRLVDPFKIEPKLETPPSGNNFRKESELRRSDGNIDRIEAEIKLPGNAPDLLLSDTSIQANKRRDSGPFPHTDENKQKVPFTRQQTYTKTEEDGATSPSKRKMSSFNEEEEDAVPGQERPRPLTNTFRREKSSPEIRGRDAVRKDPTSVWEQEMMSFNKGAKQYNEGRSSISPGKERSPSPPKAPVPNIVRTSPPVGTAPQLPQMMPPDIDSDGEGSIATLDTSSMAGSFTSQRKKTKLTRGLRAALKVLNDSIGKPVRSGQQLNNALNIIQRDWFRITSQADSDPHKVEDYLDIFEMQYSRGLMHRVINLADANGNTAMHYAVSHGNYDVVSLLLDTKVCSVNHQNKAGYTATMLVSLAPIKCEEHASVVEKLFSVSDVNVRANQHGQTALMLAVSHGRLDTVRLLLAAGADVNIQDDDGSTALMCAAEHGHLAIVRYLLQWSETDAHLLDNDGSSALAIAVEAGHKDVGVLLYKHMNLTGRGTSPYSSLRGRNRGPNLPRSSINTPPPRFSAPPSPGRSRRGSGPPSPPGSLHNSPHVRHKPSSSASLSNLNF